MCSSPLLNPNRNASGSWGTFRPFYAKLVAQWARTFPDSQGTVRAATGDQSYRGTSRLQRPGLRAPANRRSRERDHACARSRGEATDDRSVPTPPFAASQPYVTVTDNGGRTGVP